MLMACSDVFMTSIFFSEIVAKFYLVYTV